MKSIFTLSFLMSSLVFTACQRTTADMATPATGDARDAHGCIASAGYQWSPLRQACVRIFEAGLAFEPTPYNPDQTLRAYVLTLPVKGDKVTAAELHWPGEAEPWPLEVVHTPEGDIRPLVLASNQHKIKIYRTNEDAYLLERHGKVLFSFGPKEGNALDTITWRP